MQRRFNVFDNQSGDFVPFDGRRLRKKPVPLYRSDQELVNCCREQNEVVVSQCYDCEQRRRLYELEHARVLDLAVAGYSHRRGETVSHQTGMAAIPVFAHRYQPMDPGNFKVYVATAVVFGDDIGDGGHPRTSRPQNQSRRRKTLPRRTTISRIETHKDFEGQSHEPANVDQRLGSRSPAASRICDCRDPNEPTFGIGRKAKSRHARKRPHDWKARGN